MRSRICKDFRQFWESCRTDGISIPTLDHFTEDALAGFGGCEAIFRYHGDKILLEHAGQRLLEVMPTDMRGMNFTMLYPEQLSDIHEDLIKICVKQHVGMYRVSRLAYGHRHIIAEWLLLPVQDVQASELCLVGVSVTDSHSDKRDVLAAGDANVEHIMRQEYITCGNGIDLTDVSKRTWSYLKGMKTDLVVDSHTISASAGYASAAVVLAAQKAARPIVLFTGAVKDFGISLFRLSDRYHVKLAQTMAEALEILSADQIDALVVQETLPDARADALIQKCVIPDNPHSPDVVLLLNSEKSHAAKADYPPLGPVQFLVNPAGEFSLRQAIDKAVSNRRTRLFDHSGYAA